MKKDKAIPQLFGSSHAPPNLTDIEPSYANAGNLPIKKNKNIWINSYIAENTKKW